MRLVEIKTKIQAGEYRLSEHAIRRMIQRDIDRSEIEQAILAGEIIEEYPDDKYSPSCLVCGASESGRIFHAQVSLPPKVVIVTAYEPDPAEWINYRIRR